MKVFIGADHRGFLTKTQLKSWLEEQGHEVVDLGATELVAGDDYDDYAEAVGRSVASDPAARGIVICGSGVGVDMVANKIKSVRSGLGISPDQITAARADDDINVLALAADYTQEDVLREMVHAFLTTDFVREDRFVRRLERMKAIETNNV